MHSNYPWHPWRKSERHDIHWVADKRDYNSPFFEDLLSETRKKHSRDQRSHRCGGYVGIKEQLSLRGRRTIVPFHVHQLMRSQLKKELTFGGNGIELFHCFSWQISINSIKPLYRGRLRLMAFVPSWRVAVDWYLFRLLSFCRPREKVASPSPPFCTTLRHNWLVSGVQKGR